MEEEFVNSPHTGLRALLRGVAYAWPNRTQLTQSMINDLIRALIKFLEVQKTSDN